MFTDYESVAQIAPGGNFFDTTTINCDNPLFPAQQLATIGCGPARNRGGHATVPLYIGRRNVEGGGRQQSFENSSFRALVGVRGEITEAWDYDVIGAVLDAPRVRRVDAQLLRRSSRMQRALDVVDVGGVPTCRSVLDGTDPNCVPYNPFVAGGVTPAQLDYLQAPGMQTGRSSQEIYNGVVTGDLGTTASSCRGRRGIKVAFGVEYRRDALHNNVDALQTAGPAVRRGRCDDRHRGLDQGERPLHGSPRSAGAGPDVRGEPLVRHRLSLLGLRRRRQTDTYKFGLDWAPVADVRFRGSYQRAVRAANIVELFTAQGFNLFDCDGDPCGARGARSGSQRRGVRRDRACRRASVGAAASSTARRVSTTSSRAATRT